MPEIALLLIIALIWWLARRHPNPVRRLRQLGFEPVEAHARGISVIGIDKDGRLALRLGKARGIYTPDRILRWQDIVYDIHPMLLIVVRDTVTDQAMLYRIGFQRQQDLAHWTALMEQHYGPPSPEI